jgi:hypothetical protein
LKIVTEDITSLELEIARGAENPTVEQRQQKQTLVAQYRRLKADVRQYHVHCEQYEKQRKRVQRIEAALTPGEAVVYRDFVNDHDERGKKVCNLVLVIRQRLQVGQELSTINIHNFGDAESCDAFWTADVFDFHLAPGGEHHSGLFDDITKLTIAGDHGPHFSANTTVFNETTFFAKYNKAVESIFLCSYHAYNRCDGAGVVPKRLSKQAQREGAGPIGGASYAHAVNMSNYLNHVAFHFDQVNRSEYVFSSELQEYTNMRKMCHFQYHYIDAHGAVAHEPGIVLVKMTSDDALSFQVIDMVRRQPEQAMCPRCSNHHQRPVQHNVEKK